MGRPKLTHCKHGHDIAVVGRYSNGECRACRLGSDSPVAYLPGQVGPRRKAVCKRGHPRTPENVQSSNGSCRPCNREYVRLYHQRRRNHRKQALEVTKAPRAWSGPSISAIPLLAYMAANAIDAKEFGRRYANAHGGSAESGKRLINRLHQQGVMRLVTADAACIALGRHPAELYGSEWFEVGVADAV